MSTVLQFRRGTTAQLASQAGAVGELFVDTTKDTLVVMDGVTAGGYPLARESSLSLKQDTLVSGNNIKTINNTSILGEGNINVSISSIENTTSDVSFYPTMVSSINESVSTLTTSSTKLYFSPITGSLNATNFNSLSDINHKENINTIESPLSKVKSIRGVTYTLKDSGEAGVGVIAQEIEQILPEVVHTNSNGIKTVSYGNIVGLLIEAIKEQQKQIDELRSLLNK